VEKNPSGFNINLKGHHDHPDSNGTYEYDGEENGKPKWAKSGTNMKLFWTGSSWDVSWGGFSPEAVTNMPVPPLSGYEKDRGNCDIKVSYVRISPTIGKMLSYVDMEVPYKINVTGTSAYGGAYNDEWSRHSVANGRP